MIGSDLGTYRIVERLGEGGMGTVYRAVDVMLDRDVAIKVLRPELAQQTALVDRFRAEAVALARLNHPNIATLYGLHRHEHHLFMAMEFVRGDTLEQVLERSGRLGWQRAIGLCRPVLDALDHAHDHGVVHRDIKPANIMVSTAGVVKVMDFGIARLMGRSRQTQHGSTVGTPLYMSPEQLRGEDVDGRTDLYSLGIVLFELITGEMAFQADSDYSLMMAQLNKMPPLPSSRVRDVPPPLDQIVMRAVQKDRAQRFASAAEFRVALEHVGRSDQPQPAAVITPPTRIATAEIADDAPRISTPPVVAPPIAQAASRVRRFVGGDPRMTLSAVLVLLAAGLLVYAAVPMARDAGTPPPTPEATGHAATPDAAPSVVPSGEATPGTASAASVASAIPITTQAGRTIPESVAVVRPRREPTEPTPAAKTRPPANDERNRAGAPPAESAPAAKSPESSSPNADSARREPTKPGSPVDASTQVSRELARVASLLRARNTVELAALIGAASDQEAKNRDGLLALVRRSPIAVDEPRTDASPDLSGSRVAIGFNMIVRWRSPFGANRERPVTLSAEMELSGGTWRLVRCRVLGAPDFS